MNSPINALIDLEALKHNLRAVRSYVGPRVQILAVVKADAYGHGVAPVARTALESGASYLGVARVHEGVELRKAGFKAPILVFEAAAPEAMREGIAHGLELTIVSNEAALAAENFAREYGIRAKVHIKVDTGMGRLGLSGRDAFTCVTSTSARAGLDIAGLYSHFATSEDPDQSFAHAQLDRFLDLAKEIRTAGVSIPLLHMANSGAIISMPEGHLDLVRPGIMLYGYPPRFGMSEQHPVKPVLSLHSRVAFVKEVERGTSVSYGRRYLAPKRTRIATVPAGYADGYSRLLTNKSFALIRGRRYPVVGTVCMDQLMVDAGTDTVEVGDDVILIGSEGREKIDAWDLAAMIGTIPYEITCLITGRVPRICI